MTMINYIRSLEKLDGVRVLVRCDFNVPVEKGMVVDDFRIRHTIPTLSYLLERGAQLILISHIETKDNPTLEPVAQHLNDLGIQCVFEKNYRNIHTHTEKVILLENVRSFEGEKKNDKKFAQELASLADIYVNDAFSVSHRAHASISAITQYIPSYAGIQFEDELKHLSSAFNPEHPFLFVLGGAKFDTKLPLIEKFMGIADKVFVGGALANNFFKEQGKDIGNSMVSPENFNLERYFDSPKLLLPVDSVIEEGRIMDAGEKTVSLLKDEIQKARYILWNGPLGAYEKGFKNPTLELARMIAQATERGAVTVIGGGDTLATIAELKLEGNYTFVSTAGGAMLDYLSSGTLPGIEALEKTSI